jgi:hypothetical protein
MENSLYDGMLESLANVKMSGAGRAQAHLHMRRAATLVEMFLGSRAAPAMQPEAKAEQREEYRRAA